MEHCRFGLVALSALTLIVAPLGAQQKTDVSSRPEETEVYHPVPPIVTTVFASAGSAPPSDAIVLFDGTNLDEWVNTQDGSPAGWTVSDGVMIVNKAAGNIRTRRHFRDFQIHIEWRVPEGITGDGQARGNSGLFLASRDGRGGYELQILDSYQNSTYVNGMAGSIYKQSIPLANASRKPGEWQTYDVVWTAPTFNADGSLKSSARVTVLYNGVLIQNDFELHGETAFIGSPQYHAYDKASVMLQAHRDPSPPISFRNIWLRVLR